MPQTIEQVKDATVSAIPVPRRILIVEDEALIAMDLRRQLEDLGYHVPGVAASADQAVKLAGCHRPDLILMDIRLKDGSDGIKAADEVWQRFHIPVVFVTAHEDAKTLARAKLSNPFGYIVKPFVFVNFRVTIEIALQNSETELSLRRSLDRHGKLEAQRMTPESGDRRQLTICAWTGQVKTGEQWLPIERYLLHTHGISVTHGLSPQGIPLALGEQPLKPPVGALPAKGAGQAHAGDL